MKISIVTVAFNSESTIRTTLASIESQRYSDIEYVVIDGESTDRTLEILSGHLGQIDALVSEPDCGIYDAMNKGISLTTGEIIGILNSDDFYPHTAVLDEVAACFQKDPDLDVVLGNVDFVRPELLDRSVRNIQCDNFKPFMFMFGLMPPHPAVFVRKSAYERVGSYKPGYKIAADFDFLTRLLLVDKAKYHIASKTWVRMRTGGASTRGLRSTLTITKEMERSLKENNVLANKFLLMLRLPLKYVTQVLNLNRRLRFSVHT